MKRIGSGSPELFTIAAVCFSDPAVAACCEQRISGLRKELSLPDDYEFKFTRAKKYRQRFLKAVSGFSFTYVARTIAKKKLSGKEWHKKSYFYQRACAMAVHGLLPFLRPDIYPGGAEVIVDASGDEGFDQALVKYLRKHATDCKGNRLVKRVRTLPSHKYSLIQLADMVCGAVARSHQEEADDPVSYIDIIKDRKGSVEIWP